MKLLTLLQKPARRLGEVSERPMTFRHGGVHPPEQKHTPADRIIVVDLPTKVSLPLKQHIGPDALSIVKKGDYVVRGQKIAEASAVVSAPVHASISGIVTSIGPVRLTSGRWANAITIEASAADNESDTASRFLTPVIRDVERLTPEEIVGFIANAGIVGLGGATFPTAVKLTPPPGTEAELLIINACECEPCLTCDDTLMRAHPDEIIEGIILLMRGAKVDKAVIGIESNKPQAFAALSAAISRKGDNRVKIQVLQTKYPQGGEKQLIQAITGREVPSGCLPIQAGCIVQNIGTAYATYQAVALGIPLIERVVTVVGKGNFLVPIGIIADPGLWTVDSRHTEAEGVVSFPLKIHDNDVVSGGPMMGQSIVTLDAPVLKGTSGITVLPGLKYDPAPCVRCAACVEACPMGLQPYLLASYGRKEMFDEAREAGLADCMECGCCSYSCPSGRPIVDYIRYAKNRCRQK